MREQFENIAQKQANAMMVRGNISRKLEWNWNWYNFSETYDMTIL